MYIFNYIEIKLVHKIYTSQQLHTLQYSMNLIGVLIFIMQELLQMHYSEVHCEEKGGEVIPRPINCDHNI